MEAHAHDSLEVRRSLAPPRWPPATLAVAAPARAQSIAPDGRHPRPRLRRRPALVGRQLGHRQGRRRPHRRRAGRGRLLPRHRAQAPRRDPRRAELLEQRSRRPERGLGGQDRQGARREVPDRRLDHQVRHREQGHRRRRRRRSAVRRFGLGKVGTQKGKATVAVTVRMIDTSTGEIMASAKGEGESSAQRPAARRRRRRQRRRRRRRRLDGLVGLPRHDSRRSDRDGREDGASRSWSRPRAACKTPVRAFEERLQDSGVVSATAPGSHPGRPARTSCAPATTVSPLTWATPLSTPTRLRRRCTRASMTTESPGCTGRR